MSLKERIDVDLKQALKAGDKLRLSCLRMLKSRIQEKELALRAEQGKAVELTDDEAVEVVALYAKQATGRPRVPWATGGAGASAGTGATTDQTSPIGDPQGGRKPAGGLDLAARCPPTLASYIRPPLAMVKTATPLE